MLKKDNFFKSYFINSGKYYVNIKKTKKIYNSFITDLKNYKIPLLASYEKDYKFDFSTVTSRVTAGQIIAISFDPTSSHNDTVATIVFKFDGNKPLGASE